MAHDHWLQTSAASGTKATTRKLYSVRFAKDAWVANNRDPWRQNGGSNPTGHAVHQRHIALAANFCSQRRHGHGVNDNITLRIEFQSAGAILARAFLFRSGAWRRRARKVRGCIPPFLT